MDKKAILLVSIGTSRIEVLEKTTFKLLEEIKEQFKDYHYYVAFSGKYILEKMNKISDEKFLSVEDVFEKMKSDEIEEVYLQPTFLLNGLETEKLHELVNNNRTNFRKIEVGLPLLAKKEEYVEILQGLLEESQLEENEALLLIGHGTSHSANTTYQNLEYTAYIQGFRNVFVGTVEGEKSQRMILRKLNAAGYQKVCIMPFLFVAGYHALKDISAESDAWRSVLVEAGYNVRSMIRGLGEQKKIRELFLKHLQDILDKTKVGEA